MTQQTTASAKGNPAVHNRVVPGITTPIESGLRRARPVGSTFPAALLVAGCVALHLLAASVVYHDVARDLYALFDATPRLLVLERGLVRLTAATVFLPPVIPTLLLVGAALWVGRARRLPEVARWLALAALPLAVDGVLRAVGVMIAPAPATIGDLLDLPTRFSPGPRLVLDLAGIRPPASIVYWSVVCTVAAGFSAWCVARALLAADRWTSDARDRRRRGSSAIDAVQVGIAVTGVWVVIAFAGQVVLPWATQLFLRTFG